MDQILTNKINADAVWALPLYASITGRDATFESFNGTFGGKNATYGLGPLTQYGNFDDYAYAWLSGAERDYVGRLNAGSLSGSSAERIVNCIKDDNLIEFILLYLIRTFYRETGILATSPIGNNVRQKVAQIKALP